MGEAVSDDEPTTRPAVERSAHILEAAGYRLLPLREPIGPWQLLAVDPRGVLLLAVVEGACPAGVAFGVPGAFPRQTKCLVHVWEPDAALPKTLSFGE